jgi:putative endopeptidase
MPDRDYYLSDDPRSKELREKYLLHLKNMFVLIGDSPDVATKNAATIMRMETQLAKASKTRVEQRDPVANYNKLTIEDLQRQTAGFDWKLYFDGIGLPSIKDVNVGQPAFLVEVSKMFKEVPVEDWKVFLRWKLIHGAASFLSTAFDNENFDFYGKTLSGTEKMKDRWKRVTNITSSCLGEAVGELFVKKYFPLEAKEKMLKLVGNLKVALEQRIKGLTWMTDVTKAKAIEKLAKMNVKIGYPDKWRDYSKLDITADSYVMNVFKSSKFDFEYELAKIGKPVDRGEWHMTPQTVNAYYSPNMNEIVFPAAILQPPFFNVNADDAVNYGAIGVVIGHEMTHGFDDQGRQYDKDGNLQDWWTEEDAKNFNEKVAVLVAEADNYVELDSIHLDGKLTLGENIADFGGLTVALTALKNASNNNLETPKADGFTPLQRYFISFAQIWRQNIRDKDLMRRIKEDVHSPGDYRVNGALPNVPEFYQAFGIKEGDKLFIATEKRALIW